LSLSATSHTSPEGEISSQDPEVLHNPTWILAQPIIWVFGAVALLFPYVPVYFKYVGMSEREIAILLGTGPVFALTVQQLWGYLSDVLWNRRRVMILLSFLTLFVTTGFVVLAYGFPQLQIFWVLLLLYGLMASVNNPRISMTVSMVMADRDGQARFPLIRTMGTLSFIVMCGSAGWLADRFDIRVIFPMLIGINILMIFSLIPIRDVMPRSQIAATGDVPPPLPGFWHVQKALFAKPAIRWFFAFVAMTQLAHGAAMIFQSVLIQELGGQNRLISYALNLGAVAEIAALLGFAFLMRHIRLMGLLMLAFLGSGVRWLLIYLATHIDAIPTMPVLIASNVFHMFSFGLMYMACVVMVEREVPAAYRTSGQTMLGLIFFTAGAAGGPLLSALFFQFGSLTDLYGAAALITFLATPLWWRMKKSYEKDLGVSGFWIRQTPSR
jgi:MFS transporter, PPP family, 3-phenylpropionic acid transporter